MKSYRKSNYLIAVPLIKHPGRSMLIHGYTGAIDIATDNVVNFLKDHVTFSQEEFPLSEKTLEMLEQRGYVTDKTAAEERQHVRRWAELFHKYNKAFSPGFMFLVSYDCNFRSILVIVWWTNKSLIVQITRTILIILIHEISPPEGKVPVFSPEEPKVSLRGYN